MCACLHSQTCDGDLNWKKGLCRCDQVKDLDMRSSWVIGVALNLVAGVLIGNTQGGDPGGEERPWDWGQRLQRCGQSQGHQSRRKPEEAKGGLSPGPLGRARCRWTLISDSGPPELTEGVFYCLSHQGLMTCYGSCWELVYLFIYPPAYLYHLTSI